MASNLINILFVGAGSCLGGVSRYLLGKFLGYFWPYSFPWGTFIINIIGCFILGMIYGSLDKGYYLSSGLKLFLTVGFCGGFTTFSTFINENFQLLQQGLPIQFTIYSAASFAVGLLFLYMGYHITRLI